LKECSKVISGGIKKISEKDPLRKRLSSILTWIPIMPSQCTALATARKTSDEEFHEIATVFHTSFLFPESVQLDGMNYVGPSKKSVAQLAALNNI
jgi:hypothetical protein